MDKVTASFENSTVYVGLDVHKRSWNAGIFLDSMYVRNVHQPPSPAALSNYLKNNYPGANYKCAYESGKFGFWIQRQLSTYGIECLVVNPADIPGTQKDDVYKTDVRDARTIGHALALGQLRGIFVPPPTQEADRCLVRQRKKIWRDLVRCKNRVKGFLDYHGIVLPVKFGNPNWSHNFIACFNELKFDHSGSKTTLNYQVREVQYLLIRVLV